MENFLYYIFCIVAFIVAVFVMKKVASCMIKSVIFVIIIGILAVVYFMFMK